VAGNWQSPVEKVSVSCTAGATKASCWGRMLSMFLFFLKTVIDVVLPYIFIELLKMVCNS
jgi:hypothetical protein